MSPEALLRTAIMRAKNTPPTHKVISIPIVESPACRYCGQIIRRNGFSIVPDIIRLVAVYYGVMPNDIKAHRRTKDIILPRHVAIYLAKELTGYSCPQIGLHFDGRDHSTISHAINKIAQMCEQDPAFRLEIGNIKALITRGME